MPRAIRHLRAAIHPVRALVALTLVIQLPWLNVTAAPSLARPPSTFASNSVPVPRQVARGPFRMQSGPGASLAPQQVTSPTATSTPRPTETPTPIPGTQTTDLIVNGGFESGQRPPWQEQSAGNYELISMANPHTGSFSAQFCGSTLPCNDQLWQTITVPAQVDTATLTFWLSVTGQPATGCNDSFTAALRSPSGVLIAMLFTTPTSCTAPSGWVQETSNVTPELQAYAGQQVQVYFQGKASDSASFFLDDVSLMVQAPLSPTAAAVASQTAAAAATSTVTGGTISPTAAAAVTGTAAAATGTAAAVATGTAALTNTIVPTPTPRPTLTPTPIPNTQTTELIVNGGFESGQAPWQEQSAGDYQLINQAKPHSGSSSAEFCGANTACNDQLWQTVTLPAQFDTLTLSFWLWISTQSTTPTCADTFVALIRTAAGAEITPVTTKCNSDATNDWLQVTDNLAAALQPFAGQQIQVYFQAVTGGTAVTAFYLDDVSLLAQVPIPTATPTSTATSTPTNTPVPTATPLPTVQVLGVQLLRRKSGVITDTCDTALTNGTPLSVTQLLYPNQTGILRVLYRVVNQGTNPVVGQVVYEEKGKPVDGDVLLPAANAQLPFLCTTLSFSGPGVHHFRAQVTVTLGQAVATGAVTFYVGKCGHGVTSATGQCARCNTGYRLRRGACQKIQPQVVAKPTPTSTPRRQTVKHPPTRGKKQPRPTPPKTGVTAGPGKGGE